MFSNVETAIAECESHLDATGSRNSPVDIYLAGFLLIHIYATLDERIKNLCKARCMECSDPPIGTLALKTLRPRAGDIKVSILGDILKVLDEELKTPFADSVSGGPSNGAWDNLITNRHSVAHTSALPQVNVSDVRNFYHSSLDVIREFENCMNKSMGNGK